jgi:hypothetical protein
LVIQNNQLQFQRTGRPPVAFDGRPALSIAGYLKAIQDTDQKINAALQEERDLIAETQRLTAQINGTRPPGEGVTAVEKGLRGQLADQESLLKGLLLEQQYLRSPLTYVTLQTEQLRQRRAALAQRLDELTRAVSAQGRPK